VPFRFEWHQDGGRQNREIETDPRPRLSVKLAYWLSDVSGPGRGIAADAAGSWYIVAARAPVAELSVLAAGSRCGSGCAPFSWARVPSEAGGSFFSVVATIARTGPAQPGVAHRMLVSGGVVRVIRHRPGRLAAGPARRLSPRQS